MSTTLTYTLHDTNVFQSEPLCASVLAKLVSLVSHVDHKPEQILTGQLTCQEAQKDELLCTLRSLGFRVHETTCCSPQR